MRLPFFYVCESIIDRIADVTFNNCLFNFTFTPLLCLIYSYFINTIAIFIVYNQLRR